MQVRHAHVSLHRFGDGDGEGESACGDPATAGDDTIEPVAAEEAAEDEAEVGKVRACISEITVSVITGVGKVWVWISVITSVIFACTAFIFSTDEADM